MGLSPAARVGTRAASKNHAGAGRETLLDGGRDHFLRAGGSGGQPVGRGGG